MQERNEKQLNRSGRPQRVPLQARNILTVKGVPEDLHACWVNDTENNVERYLDAGYSFWEGTVSVGEKKVDSNSQIGKRVSKNVGNGVTAFLMVIPKDLWEEDFKAEQRKVTENEAALFRSIEKGEGRYGSIRQEASLKHETSSELTKVE